MQDAPQTAQGLAGVTGRSASNDFFAISKICGAIIGSFISFFFIAVYTIAHFEPRDLAEHSPIQNEHENGEGGIGMQRQEERADAECRESQQNGIDLSDARRTQTTSGLRPNEKN